VAVSTVISAYTPEDPSSTSSRHNIFLSQRHNKISIFTEQNTRGTVYQRGSNSHGEPTPKTRRWRPVENTWSLQSATNIPTITTIMSRWARRMKSYWMSSHGGSRVNENVDVSSAGPLRPSEGWCRDLMFFSCSCNLGHSHWKVLWP